mmetsp:Transcript_58113/g.92354  ORF Transcript_58113/g.92354 Transcript_58113/m.92354 type:complete len:854 (-) Transcript_58113:251-2812(-)
MPPKRSKKSKVEPPPRGPPQGRTFAEKFFTGDRLSLHAFSLLRPQHRFKDIVHLDPLTIGDEFVEIGEGLAKHGSFPKGDDPDSFWNYTHEHSLEFCDSVDILRQALKVVTSHEFKDLMCKAAKQAYGGYYMLGTFGTRLASLRWLCCMTWLSARASCVGSASCGSGFGTIDANKDADACKSAKTDMFKWISELTHEAPVLKVFDHDLLGCGVYMNLKAEDLPRGGDNDYFRRQMEFDIARLCDQVNQLPPAYLNDAAPFLPILRPYGERTWELRPPDALRFITEKHDWLFEVRQPKIDDVPHKALVQGPVVHMGKPPPPEFDITDPEIILKIQRDEDLGKGTQEDGLPGAVHGSIGLLFAGRVGIEGLENVRMKSDLLQIDNFLESFLKYTTPLQTLDLSGADGVLDEDHLQLLPLCGPSLTHLDLERCGLDGFHVDTLAEVFQQLEGLKHIDLSHNSFDASSAAQLLASLAENRVDVETLRLDGNPLGDPYEFRQDVAGLLATRGDQVVAGGELVFHLNVSAVRWFAQPPESTLAARRRDDTCSMSATSYDELIQSARLRNEFIDKLFEEGIDRRTKTAAGREIFDQKRQLNDTILADNNLCLWTDSEKKVQEITQLETEGSVVAYLPKTLTFVKEGDLKKMEKTVLVQVDASTWRAQNDTLRSGHAGLYYRLTKRTDSALEGRKLEWNATTTALDEGDGWVKVHLPKVLPPPKPKPVEKDYVWRISKDRRLMEVAFPIPEKVQDSDIIYKLSREDDDETRGQLLKMGYRYREHAFAARRDVIVLEGRLLQRVVREKCSWTIEEFPSVRICVLSMPRPSRIRANMPSFMCELFEEALGETSGDQHDLIQTN